ncbi:hypothetical protein NDA11_006033 [Ustilago hordei]|uniref:Integrase catalytic domain-containing protein n=1 Tax=Ustilago hordei TaxID=120017 RepID=I2G686_USTHO|nr:hypothetical protein NDA10_002377 [Ustilago hordei]KAJ1586288.1 hypothetical protein NDA12_006628 [Ustilago hordei]KAJ1589575.1 hypothetical protein NDA15_006666 [Ustilago hordei]KAJ1591085.1 hypothetical protein NDA11_006033 [Ustilago hordei]KAJ1600600.1 hypothetical protein NDA14_001738 [Ustilago hordei]
MVCDENKLIAPMPRQGFIDTTGQEQLQVQVIGDVTLQVGDAKIPLTDVLYVPNLSKNLLSVPVLTENGACVIFEESGATILQHDGSVVKSKTSQCKKRWEIHGDSLAAQLNDPLEGIGINTTPAEHASYTISKLWHEQFSHPGRNKTKQIQAHYLGKETQLEHNAKDCNCCHPNYHHALVVVDNSSTYIHVKPLLSKAEAFPALRTWIKAAETTTDHTLKCICSDNGSEWSSSEAEEWKRQAGFIWQKTTLYVSIQNGRVEHMIRSLQERMHAMLVQRSAPKELWPYAIMAVGHTLNLTPSASTNKVPYKEFYQRTAHGLAKLLQVFGCLTWIHLLKKDHTGKHATFHESKSWHNQPRIQSPLQFRFESLEAKGMKQVTDSNEPELEVEVLNIWDLLLDEHTTLLANPMVDDRSEIAVKEILGEAQMMILNLMPMLKEALAGDDAQQWQEAICKELDGLKAMGTWEIVDIPPNANLVDSKIVLKLKLDADGIPAQHKARLVA